MTTNTSPHRKQISRAAVGSDRTGEFVNLRAFLGRIVVGNIVPRGKFDPFDEALDEAHDACGAGDAARLSSGGPVERHGATGRCRRAQIRSEAR
jgi:hypothetical protein